MQDQRKPFDRPVQKWKTFLGRRLYQGEFYFLDKEFESNVSLGRHQVTLL